jgi:hypothetical protein
VHADVVQAAVSIEPSYDALSTVVVVLPHGRVVDVVEVVVVVVVVVVAVVVVVVVLVLVESRIVELEVVVVLVVVVVVLVLVESRIVELEVVLVPVHGQLRFAGCPTTDLRQIRASVAEVGRVPLGAQMHSGVQVSR